MTESLTWRTCYSTISSAKRFSLPKTDGEESCPRQQSSESLRPVLALASHFSTDTAQVNYLRISFKHSATSLERTPMSAQISLAVNSSTPIGQEQAAQSPRPPITLRDCC